MNQIAVHEPPPAVLPLEMVDPVIVSAIAHPFGAEPQFVTIRQGATVAEILEQVQPNPVLRRHAHVYVGDEYIGETWYARIRPKAGTAVTIRIIPGNSGGGKKNILATIAMIAVVIVATIATFYVGGAGGLLVGAGWSGSAAAAGGALVGAAIPCAGPLIVAAALPEPGR